MQIASLTSELKLLEGKQRKARKDAGDDAPHMAEDADSGTPSMMTPLLVPAWASRSDGSLSFSEIRRAVPSGMS